MQSGDLDETLIDDAVRRILYLKFKLGLFDEQRFHVPENIPNVLGTPEDFDCAYECAAQGIVLLKNANHTLPLSDSMKKIAVIGPNADDVIAQLGNWVYGSGQAGFDTGSHPREYVTTILDGIRQAASPTCDVTYNRGCDNIDPDDETIWYPSTG